jgi:hypothetical protein
MELQGIVLSAVSESDENGIGNKGSIGLWYFFHIGGCENYYATALLCNAAGIIVHENSLGI